MRNFNWIFKDGNWRYVIFGVAMLFGIPATIYHIANIDEAISTPQKRMEVKSAITSEYKKLYFPNKISINRTNDHGKNDFIWITVRYRTEFNHVEFYNEVKKEMLRNNWECFSNNEDIIHLDRLVCKKEKFEAELSPESRYLGSGDETGNYYLLDLRYGFKLEEPIDNKIYRSIYKYLNGE